MGLGTEAEFLWQVVSMAMVKEWKEVRLGVVCWVYATDRTP